MGNNAGRTRPSQSPGVGCWFFWISCRGSKCSIFKRRANRTKPGL